MSATKPIQTLPGFRDFFPEECAQRNYLFKTWREVCRNYGFLEYEGPILEATDLYRKKSGDEVVEQLFSFVDKGERDVALRPELTPTLARMVAARQRDFKKPLRWFSIGPFFRFERPQKGRLREFYQFNCDILGEPSEQADAELISLSIDLMLALGFRKDDFKVRLSDRQAWIGFMEKEGIDPAQAGPFLQIIDKIEREKEDVLQTRLKEIGTSLESVRAYIREGAAQSSQLTRILAALKAQGKDIYCEVDLSIVRGLAYYTGAVFELFDQKHGLRAIAGGGRYDTLIQNLSDGKADVPATGFAMGDVVMGALLQLSPVPKAKYISYLEKSTAIDVYVVIASEDQRAAALAGVQQLRDNGYRVHFPFSPVKTAKQFKSAESYQARVAVLYGDEFPTIQVKNLFQRSEIAVEGQDAMLEKVSAILSDPYPGGLYA